MDEQRWNYLCYILSQIIDPTDVYSVLDDCAADTLQHFNCAEMNLLSRRECKTVRTLMYSISTANGTGGGWG